MALKSDAEFEKKTDLLFQKWQEFGEVWPEHSKVSESLRGFICTDTEELQNILKRNRLVVLNLKFTEELYVMIMKNDAKSEEELTFYFQIYIRNFTNLDPSTRKSKQFAL